MVRVPSPEATRGRPASSEGPSIADDRRRLTGDEAPDCRSLDQVVVRSTDSPRPAHDDHRGEEWVREWQRATPSTPDLYPIYTLPPEHAEGVMTMRKLIVAATAIGTAVGAKLGIDRLRKSGRSGPAVADLRRRSHHVAGRAKGFAYHTLRRHPAADVDDATLADRVRSSIGPLEKRLDVPRVHVTVENGTVILHGEIPDSQAEADIVRAVEGIAGVRAVQSHLAATT
jgi:hypothetical protein